MIEFRSICVIFSSICFVSFRSQMLKDDSCESSLDPVVRCTKEGPVRGKRLDFNVHRSNSNKNKLSVDIFLGIPYAEPPTGERRFRKSKPISSRNRSTIFDATKYSNSCYQMIIDFLNATGEKIWAPTTSMSEDCLYLNIWKPNRVTSHKQNLPVMVWIYGGGFTSGSVSRIKSKLNSHYFLSGSFVELSEKSNEWNLFTVFVLVLSTLDRFLSSN